MSLLNVKRSFDSLFNLHVFSFQANKLSDIRFLTMWNSNNIAHGGNELNDITLKMCIVVWNNSNPLRADSVCIQNPDFVITVFADVQAVNGTRPSTGTTSIKSQTFFVNCSDW